jgi:hypothetical protein
MINTNTYSSMLRFQDKVYGLLAVYHMNYLHHLQALLFLSMARTERITDIQKTCASVTKHNQQHVYL